jgi:hypothetical protein
VADDLFDTEKHQLPEGQPQPPPEARIAQTLAAGYTYQGQLVRRSLVAVQQPQTEETASHQTSTTAESDTTASLVAETSMHTATRDSNGSATAEQNFRLESEAPTVSSDEVRQA